MTGAFPRIPVAVMAKVPVPGQVKTRLCPPLTPAQAARLARCFLIDRLEQLAALAVAAPVVAFTPPEGEGELRAMIRELWSAAGAREAGATPAAADWRLVPQAGLDLGARLDRLLSDLLAEGHPAAIAVDADSPSLPTAFLERACHCLGAGAADAVVGPCEDGGYYLIGLRRPAPELFRAMPWSTPAVLDETVGRASRLGLRLELLPPWFDVDRGEDLARLGADAESASPAGPSGGAVPYRPRRTLAFLAGALA